ATLTRALEQMPLLPYARAERWMNQSIRENAGQKNASTPTENWAKPYPTSSETYLPVAAWYRSLGDVEDSDKILRLALDRLPAPAVSPLVYYYLAANEREKGNDERADDFARQGEAAPFAKVFPNR